MSIKNDFAKALSKVFTYKRTQNILRKVITVSNALHIHKFEIDEIPDIPCVLANNHGFEINGISLDMLVIWPACQRKIIGVFYERLFEDKKYEPCKIFLEKWGAISTKQLKNVQKRTKNDEIVGIDPEGARCRLKQEGYYGAVWIAELLDYPIQPIRITSKKGYFRGFLGGYTRLEVLPNIGLPKMGFPEEIPGIDIQKVTREYKRNLLERKTCELMTAFNNSLQYKQHIELACLKLRI